MDPITTTRRRTGSMVHVTGSRSLDKTAATMTATMTATKSKTGTRTDSKTDRRRMYPHTTSMSSRVPATSNDSVVNYGSVTGSILTEHRLRMHDSMDPRDFERTSNMVQGIRALTALAGDMPMHLEGCRSKSKLRKWLVRHMPVSVKAAFTRAKYAMVSNLKHTTLDELTEHDLVKLKEFSDRNLLLQALQALVIYGLPTTLYLLVGSAYYGMHRSECASVIVEQCKVLNRGFKHPMYTTAGAVALKDEIVTRCKGRTFMNVAFDEDY